MPRGTLVAFPLPVTATVRTTRACDAGLGKALETAIPASASTEQNASQRIAGRRDPVPVVLTKLILF
jgi:hypothetical protein